jgi:hypothetical protein
LRGWLILLAALTPALAAVWACPGFVTQDGPSHLYNAHVLVRSLDPASPFRDAFAVRWEPLPNWGGHLLLAGLVSTLPPRAADRAMTTLTLVGLAAAVYWLRRRVAGGEGAVPAACLCALLAMNVVWLLGFGSFLLGAALFPLTLGVWWAGRDEGFSPRRAGALAGLTVLGYACHLVSLGLTVVGLLVLEAFTPGRSRRGRAATTATGLLPLAPLGALYLSLMRRGGGGLAPEWKHLSSPFSPRAWVAQFGWVDPVTLARKDVAPLLPEVASPAFGLLAPVVWVTLGVVLAALAAWVSRRESDRERLGWWVLAGVLLVGGAVGPDTLGATHGEYLQMRVVLLSLAALAPVLVWDVRTWTGRASLAALTVALAVQSAFVWDYALTCERTAGAVLRAAGAVGTGRRVAPLLVGIRTRFRSNPLLHADGLLGVGTDNTLWADYETRFYYFPVRFRDGLDRPDPAELEVIALMDDPRDADERARRWSALLKRHHTSIDALLAWGSDPALDAVTVRWYRVAYSEGPVRVFLRSP